MIKLAKAYEPRGEFYVKDITQPLDLNIEFDGIFCQAVLLHFPKPKAEEILKSLIDCLKPGGYLLLGVKSPRPGQQAEEIITENDYGYEYQRFFSFYTADEIKNYMNNLSMSIINETVVTRDNTNWLISIAKKNI